MAVLEDLTARVLRLLGAVDTDTYDPALLIDGINAGLEAILPWTPNTATYQLTGDGSQTVFALPTDLYDLEAVVVNETGEILHRANLTPGAIHGENISGTNDWLLYPNDQITFSKAIPNNNLYDLFYLAYWEELDITDPGETTVAIPRSSELGVVLYAAAYTIWPAAVGAAEYGTFKNRVDSGNPEHNPMQKAANYLLGLFQQEMNRHPRYQKATK